jgi:DNA-binding CsgD family transcriptional regulator
MRAEAAATANAEAAVRVALEADPGRAVLVRSVPGGGAEAVVTALSADDRAAPARSDLVVVDDLDLLDEPDLLALRRRARTAPLVLASVSPDHSAAATALLDYLQVAIVDVQALALDAVTAVVEAATGVPFDDRAAAAVLRWTDGRAGDVLDVARHLAAAGTDPEAGADLGPSALVGFGPTAARRPAWDADDGHVARWALATAAGVTELVPPPPGPDARPVDAFAVLASLDAGARQDAVEALLVAASTLPAGSLSPDSTLAIGRWWCERRGEPLEAAELGHLVAAIQIAFERNRLADALPLARRLWATTRNELAGAALATALGRAAPTIENQVLLEDVAAGDGPTVADAVLATSASWRFHADHLGTEAVAMLARQLDASDGDPARLDALRGALATLELHLGRPDEVEARLAVGDTSAAGPTSFAVNALVLADLARARHRQVIDRLDDELERRIDPGPNLSVDRYRFFRTVAAAQAGWPEPTSSAELDRTYRRALDVGDDWTIGWMGWGSGLQAARAGRFVTARRRLQVAVDAFERAHRRGFAMWPAAALVELDALVIGPGPGSGAGAGGSELPSLDHAVLADRAALALARAMTLRRDGAASSAVGEQLRVAMAAARSTRDVETAHLIAIERLLADLDLDEPIADPLADGVVVEVWPTMASGDGAAWDRAGTELIDRGWPVLGIRVRAAAARRLDRIDPRRSTRIHEEVRDVAAGFDGRLRPWVLGLGGHADRPTLSAREREVAEAVAAGASRDEVATSLVVSRRTIDSHLQRVYTKLGIGSRAELREWLGR